MKNKLRAQHYILMIAAIAGAVLFFMVYPSQDVRSTIESEFDKSAIKEIAKKQFDKLGFSTGEYKINDVVLRPFGDLLDSLQHDLGRQKAVQQLSNHAVQNIKPFYWQITFIKKGEPPSEFAPNYLEYECSTGEVCLRFDIEGRFIAFRNHSGASAAEKINRRALQTVFADDDSSLKRMLFASISDSLLTRLLYFNIEHNDRKSRDTTYVPSSAQLVKNNLKQGIPYQYSKEDALALVRYYLNKTGWTKNGWSVDTVSVQNVNDINAVNVRYRVANPVLGQRLSLHFQIAPTGGLLHLGVEYNSIGPDHDNFDAQHFWSTVWLAFVVLFGLVVFVIFYYRIRGRLVDTQPALIMALITGFFIALYWVLWLAGPNASFGSSDISFLLGIGFISAAACVAAFLLFAVGDSITRQFWPQRLHYYDFLRQGMLFNKPVGNVLLYSVALGLCLIGLWTLILILFPGLYFSDQLILISQQTFLPPLSLFVQSVWPTIFVVLSIFLVLASRVYGWVHNYWLTAIPVVLASALFISPHYLYGPFGMRFATGALLGIALYFIYIKWDLLILLFSYFIFLSLLGSTSGWIIPNSPDLMAFVWTLIVIVIAGATGLWAVWYGEEEVNLTKYVPAYIDEHAKQERIKQELKIAREVQQSFLPKKTPIINHLDIAAVCKPAFETGGDYYDFIQLDDQRIAVTVGDVSGKGIKSAFYVTFIKGLLHSLSHENISPAEVLKRANRFFYDNASNNTFISLVYGVIDLDKKTFTFARAGHNPVLHLNTVDNYFKALRPNGLGLGLTKDKIFDNKIHEIELSITEDDLFLLYTDGITEALNERHQFYGKKRLVELLKKYHDESASSIITIINDEVSRFIGQAEQHDDMTLMAICFDELKDD